ncbi:MAG: nucleoside triphosphate pyrophosphohydrolase [Oligoflexia bacterium]|nr:nucleoside triphosphate pyrophosphohydrolase [Oligoflexia bacterium]
MATIELKELLSLMERLRSSDGCPWDREQTLHSLIPFLIEEAYEVVEAIELEDNGKLQEELGDLLFQIVFLAQMAKEKGWFEMKDIIPTLHDKMVRRHPHVFEDKPAKNAKEAISRWQAMKEKEKVKDKEVSIFEEVPHQLPAIMRAQKITEKASKVGFDWDNVADILEKVEEEIGEFKDALKKGEKVQIEEELGDTLFAMVNLGRFLEIDVEHSLRKATNKFITRFDYITEKIEKKKDITEASLEEMEELWEEAKANLKR